MVDMNIEEECGFERKCLVPSQQKSVGFVSTIKYWEKKEGEKNAVQTTT